MQQTRKLLYQKGKRMLNENERLKNKSRHASAKTKTVKIALLTLCGVNHWNVVGKSGAAGNGLPDSSWATPMAGIATTSSRNQKKSKEQKEA